MPKVLKEGLVCKRADYIRAKLLEEQESVTPEQEAELATIPENEMVGYQVDKWGHLSVLYTFKTPRRVSTKSNKKGAVSDDTGRADSDSLQLGSILE